MRKKTCIYCKQVSYSSYDKEWICPYCRRDITNVKSEAADVARKDPKRYLSEEELSRRFHTDS
ncbi:MAG: hypothetical protein H0Z33_06755 [Bacillaceae bacterium]|nr:hypothetical protein [Bacillaceae bacterium]